MAFHSESALLILPALDTYRRYCRRLDTLEEIVHSCISRLEDDHGVVKHELVEVNQQIGESRSAFDDLREEVK